MPPKPEVIVYISKSQKNVDPDPNPKNSSEGHKKRAKFNWLVLFVNKSETHFRGIGRNENLWGKNCFVGYASQTFRKFFFEGSKSKILQKKIVLKVLLQKPWEKNCLEGLKSKILQKKIVLIICLPKSCGKKSLPMSSLQLNDFFRATAQAYYFFPSFIISILSHQEQLFFKTMTTLKNFSTKMISV